MEAVHDLLDVPASALAETLRSGLVGLRATLADALDRSPADPGAHACARLLAALDAELHSGFATTGTASRGTAPRGPSTVGIAPGDPPPVPDEVRAVPVGVPVDEVAARLTADAPAPPTSLTSPAVAALLARPDAPPWLAAAAAGSSPAQLWRRAHVAALRLPPAAADAWRAAVAAALPPPAGSAPSRTLPGDADLALVPSHGAEPGWHTATAASADPEIVRCLRTTDGPRGELARLCTCVLGMVELDDELLLGLESVRFRGLGGFDDTLRTAFRRELIDRLTALGATAHGTPASFEALLLVDEALHSVLHIPVPAAGSWWARLNERSRTLVFDARRDHPGTDVMVLARSYREAKTKTGGRDIRYPFDGSGNVLSCLRLWAQVDGRQLPGRVVWAG